MNKLHDGEFHSRGLKILIFISLGHTFTSPTQINTITNDNEYI